MSIITASNVTIRFGLKRSERLLVEAALRWHQNKADVKRVRASLERCEDEVSYDDAEEIYHGSDQRIPLRAPCWKHFRDEDGVPMVDHFCDTCRRNEPRAVELRRLRAQRGGYTGALARAAKRVAAERAGKPR